MGDSLVPHPAGAVSTCIAEFECECVMGGESDAMDELGAPCGRSFCGWSSNVRPLGRGAPVSCAPPLAALAKSPECENG